MDRDIHTAVFAAIQERLELTIVPLLRAWAGISDELFTRITTPLGGPPQFIRQIALIPYEAWDSAMHNIPREPHLYADHPPSFGPTPLEWVSILSFRRASRMLSSLPPDEEDKSPTADKEVPSTLPPLPEPKSTVKLSELVNPKWDHKLVPLSNSTVSAMYERHSETFGMDPSEDIEPTTDQIAAIKMLDDFNFVPGVDFSLFGPHGQRAINKLTYAAQMWDPETQSYKRRDLPGPPDFDTWLRSWNVFKCTCLLLDICKVEPLDAYSDHIRSLHHEHGQKHWFIILQADSTQRGILSTMATQRRIQTIRLANESCT
jgi:hypothetical protein